MANFALLKESVQPIYDAAQRFCGDCLEHDGSLFFPESIWNLENLSKLKHDFTDNPDEGSSSFIDKLKKQLSNSARPTIRLMAEAMSVYYLFPSSIGGQHKKKVVSEILSWAGDAPLPDDDPLCLAFETGIGNPGQAYKQSPYWETSFIINFAVAYKSASDEVREKFSIPAEFINFLKAVEVPNDRKIQGRNILAHLLYPQSFERITIGKHKREIIQAFTGLILDDADNIDEKLLEIRMTQEKQYPGRNLDFYRPPLSEVWGWGEPSPKKKASMIKNFKEWMAKQQKPTGDLYSPNTVNAYARTLKNTTAKLTGLDGIYANLFKYANAEEFEDIYERILKAPNFEKIDSEAGNRSYSNAMKMYKRFLLNLENPGGDGGRAQPNPSEKSDKKEAYSIGSIIDEGCFIGINKLEVILDRLRQKKNLILQGPPGTGKTWLAKRLAYALIEERDQSRVKAVQFHPNLAYEDFVRGWRPCGDGKLKLEDGPFLKMVTEAAANHDREYVIVIEEINRGQPAQIFGEMLTLLEADKRTPDEAMELCHCQYPNEKIYVPDNLYVIGTMNIADRSLALVDLALRRRFAFIDLEPLIDKPWLDWMRENHNFDSHLLETIRAGMLNLNQTISNDASLGKQFCIGHSFVTPPPDLDIEDGREWFRQVVLSEIRPQLEEYWFDSAKKVSESVEKLLESF